MTMPLDFEDKIEAILVLGAVAILGCFFLFQLWSVK